MLRNLAADGDLTDADRADLDALIERDLEWLAPGKRERIRWIAAVELAAAEDESENRTAI